MEGEKVIHYSASAAATEGVASVYAEGKKKRGRPKKYGPKKKQRLDVESPQGGQVAFCVCANLGSHVVTVDPGEDVLHKLMSISKREAKIICVLSGSGVVSAVTLRQSNPYGDTMNYEGSFDILSLSGFFVPDDNGGMKSIFGNMNVSVAGPDGRVMGGELAGLLTAAAPVQVAITSCLPSYQEPKQFAPTSSCVHATGEGETQGASK